MGLSTTLFPASISAQGSPAQESRPTVGVAFGGGSARGIAHVGVIRWFEEHHIPIDMAAGTSMGGLIGGAFATGMNSAELDAMLNASNWDEMFGASNFAFKNIRRKADARAYPSRLEFGLKRGIVPPTSLNNGEQVDLLVGRIAGALLRAQDVRRAADAISRRGHGRADRDAGRARSRPAADGDASDDVAAVDLSSGASSTGTVLVDGGAMDNVPADVVRRHGRRPRRRGQRRRSDRPQDDRLFAVRLGRRDARRDDAGEHQGGDQARADIIINVPLAGYGSLDWRRSAELIEAGYKAAEAMRDSLLPLAVSDAEYARWQAGRADPPADRIPGARVRARRGLQLQ